LEDEMSDEERIIPETRTTGPNGEDFVFYDLPESMADFTNLSEDQARQLIDIMTKASEQGLSAVNYGRYMSNPERASSVTYDPSEGARTNATGIAGSIARGAGPVAAGTLTGAGIGSVVPGIGTATGAVAGAASAAVNEFVGPLLINLWNRVSGRNDPDPRQAWLGLMDAAGVEAGDTNFEKVIENMSRAAAGAVAGVGATNAAIDALISTSGLSPTFWGNILKTFAANPTSQVTGAMGSEAAMYGTNQLADNIDANRAEEGLPPSQWARAGLNFAGGMAGDIVAGVPGTFIDSGVLATPSRGQVRSAEQSLRLTNSSVDRVQQAVNDAADLGVPIRRDDAFPPVTPNQRRVQNTIENAPGGTMGQLTRQQIARLDAAEATLGEFDVFLGQDPLFFNAALADTFIKPRQRQIDGWVIQKQSAIDRVPRGQLVDVDNTIAYIDDQIEVLKRRGGLNADVNQDVSVEAVPEGGPTYTNIYQPLITRLENFKIAFQNNTVPDLEANRAAFGDQMIPDGGYGKIPTAQERELVAGLYDSVRQDLTEAIRKYGGEAAANDFLQANAGLTEIQQDLSREVVGDFVRRVSNTGKNILDVAEDGAIVPIERSAEEAHRAARMMVEQNPEMLTRLALTGDPSSINTILPYVGTEGRDLMVSSILQDTMNKSLPNVRDLSANNLGTNIDRVLLTLGDAVDEVTLRGIELSPAEAQKLTGLRNVLDATRHPEFALASNATSSPVALASTIPGASYGAARGISQNAQVALPAWFLTLFSAGGIAKVYQSPAMRDLLLEAASSSIPATRLQQIGREMIRVASSVGYEPQGDANFTPPEGDGSGYTSVRDRQTRGEATEPEPTGYVGIGARR
jgi:hypothetical protein